MNERWIINGKAIPIEELTKEELIQAVRWLMGEAEDAHKRHHRTLEIWRECAVSEKS